MDMHGSYVLGLDLGVASIGWCLIRLRAAAGSEQPVPTRIIRSGVHLFESGTGTPDEIARGKDESHAGPRRDARSMRKAFIRRRQRRRNVMKRLQALGLVPAGDVESPQGVDSLIKALDARLREKWEAAGTTTHRDRQLLLYRLRAKGASDKAEDRLDAHELGRAILHLSMRRGFRSNRKDLAQEAANQSATASAGPASSGPQATSESASTTSTKPPRVKKVAKGSPAPRESASAGSKDLGVLESIADLKTRMEAGGFATLGAYFASLDPVGAADQRIRDRWTSRDWYLAEFRAIWAAQAKHHPHLNDAHRRDLERAIFFQRPLKSAKGLIGMCELEPKCRRAPLAMRKAQSFRVLAAVNNLKIRESGQPERGLSDDERAKVLHALMTEGDQSFAALRLLLGLKSRGPEKAAFNLEEGGEKRMVGHRTDAKLRKVFGERFDTLSEAQKDSIVTDLLQFEKPAALTRRGREHWGLSEAAAQDFGNLLLEPGYAAHSAAALSKLLPHMQSGTHFMTAKAAVYGAHKDVGEPRRELPPLVEALGALRNPAVERTLTELRKLVNAIVRRFGKPTFIRVELARDLKKPRKVRERLTRENRDRQDERLQAARAVLNHKGAARSGSKAGDDQQAAEYAKRYPGDIDRMLLAHECGWVCPYTGEGFGIEDLIGRNPRVDIEHIWPMALSLDDSFMNKTLCFANENRKKGRRTPFEAYHGTAAWDGIISRVRRFRGDAAREKLRRFLAEKIDEGFASRHLQETRLVSVRATEYLGALYGGSNGCEPEAVGGKRRVWATAGGLTAHLRREWHLNALLPTREHGQGAVPSAQASKNRSDHRHHAIDAAVIALTDARTVQWLEIAAKEAAEKGRKLFASVELPWPSFGQDLHASIEKINVSHRQSRRVSGAMHDQSVYSKPHKVGGPGVESTEHRIRKPLMGGSGKEPISVKEIERIVDPRVRAVVKAAFEKSGASKPADAFKSEGDLPTIIDKHGVAQVIRSVRISVGRGYRPVGKAARAASRYVKTASNHSTIITGRIVPGGTTDKWEDAPLTLLDAYEDKGKAASKIAAYRREHNTPQRVAEARKSWPKASPATLGVPGEPNTAASAQDGPDGRAIVMTLSANEYLLMQDEHGVECLYRVSNLSRGDIEIVHNWDGRDSKERKDDRIRLRKGAIARGGFRKAVVTYLGEIKRSGG